MMVPHLARLLGLTLMAALLCLPLRSAETDPLADLEAEFDEPEAKVHVNDPLAPVNRVFFVFNDKLYYWVLKPVATGYGKVVPEGGRKGVRNAFDNLRAPIRVVGNLLQLKFKRAGTEVARFGVNTTFGVLGLFDPATSHFKLTAHDEDLGQTLGHYGLGNGPYIVWPFLGPSNLRDSVGMAGDSFLDPLSYPQMYWYERGGLRAFEVVNGLSLRLNAYDDLIREALDPYILVRDAYTQNRAKKVKE